MRVVVQHQSEPLRQFALGFLRTTATATESVYVRGLASSRSGDSCLQDSATPCSHITSIAAATRGLQPPPLRSSEHCPWTHTPAPGIATHLAQPEGALLRRFATLCGARVGRQQLHSPWWRPGPLGAAADAAASPSTAAAAGAPLLRRSASVQAKDVRVGMLVLEGGSLLSVSKAVHTAGIARQGGIVQLEFRDVRSGAKSTSKAAPADMLQLADTERRPMQLLYRDNEGVHLMDPASFEQVTVQADVFSGGDAAKWIRDGMDVDVLFFDGKPVSAQLPTSVVVRVTDTPTDRLSEANARKTAVVDTGATVMVPPFVQNGDDIVVNTSTGEFVRRASS